MEYELYNPSDPYTFIAESKEVAALTVFLLGTQYGAGTKYYEKELRIPIFLTGGAVEWYKEEFGRTPDEGLEELKIQVSHALDSFMLGGFEKRALYNAALEAIDDPEKKETFKEKWQNECTSLNNIGRRAHRMAKMILEDQT